MDDKAWELLMEDIREIKADVREVKKEMSGMRLKIATMSSMFGVIGAYIKTKFFQ